MSEPVTRVRPSIDLDEFEQRMGAGSHDARHEDPLAELARLVGEEPDPYRDVFAHEPAQHDYADHVPALSGNFSAIEAGLRGGFTPQAEHDAYYDPHDQYEYQGHEPQAYAEQPAPSRRPVYIMVGVIALGVFGIGGAFALKGHSTSPSEVKTIMASAAPTKIQPPADASGDQSAQDAGVLGKGNQPSPTKLVSNKEEPVDVTQAVQNTARGSTDASSVPVPPPPGQADASGPSSYPNDFGVGMPAPKKVKVVSVRPDGTILSDDSPSAAPTSPDTPPAPPASAAAAEPAPAPVTPAPAANATTPKVAPAAKSATRVTPKVAKVDAADSTPPDGAQASPDAPKTHKTKTAKQKVAMADPADTASPADDAATKSKGTGSFAVQLAAPGSESEARSASSRLAKKYSSALDGHHLAFHKAESNGKSVYRVRVSSLSKDEAVSLCDKLKADGGSCFVAKN